MAGQYDPKVTPLRSSVPQHIIVLLLVACVVVSLSCGSDVTRKGPVATVNGKPITAKRFLAELRRRNGRRVLDQLVVEKLIRQRAAALGLTATDDELDRAYSEAVAHAGSEADLRMKLKRLGLSEAEFRKGLELDVLLGKIAEQSIKVTPEEIRAYYAQNLDEFKLGERVRVRFMMLETKENAEQLRAALDQPGADFAGLARQFSIDPATKDKGGDTGYFERGQYFAKPIEDVAFSLKKGETSKVFKGPDGWCILQLIDRKPPETQPLGAVEDQIRSRISYRKKEEMKQTWPLDAKKRADITILADDLKPLSADKLRPK